jgi:two-component system, OmpR family, phosphate regulon sensor histidine kinase PhoR
MFSRNISPRTLSFFAALGLSVPISILIGVIEKSWAWGLGSFLVILAVSYLMISIVLERFIYRNVKLIYKFINQTKATHKEETYYKYVLPTKSLDEVKEDVEAWAEESKQEIETLRQNEQFRKEFLQNLSHEFKTPVFAIQGYIDTLLQGAMKDPQTNKNFLEKTSRNVERLSNLINDLDVISRLERGELVLSKSSFVIQDVIRDIYESLAVKAESKQIQCAIKKGCESPIMVRADKEKIRQVIGNLVENSLKYGKPGGLIEASIYVTDGRTILVEISDDGIGIPERHLHRIFERFYRTEEGRRMDVTGSGLGLAICKHIIEAHSQNIHVRSTEGVGTTVGFTLDRF